MLFNSVTGFSKGYGFVEYRSDRDANKAWRELHNENIDGCSILVEYEAARTLKGWIPRRLGGGFGGRKESGQLRFGGRDRPFRRPIPSEQDRKQHKYLRGSHDYEGARGAREDYRDSYREQKSENYNHREERDRDRSREKRERDKAISRSSSYYRDHRDDIDPNRDGRRHRERDSEKSRDNERARVNERSRDSERSREREERYKERARHGDGESRRKERHGYRDNLRESYEASDKERDTFYRQEPKEGKIS